MRFKGAIRLYKMKISRKFKNSDGFSTLFGIHMKFSRYEVSGEKNSLSSDDKSF